MKKAKLRQFSEEEAVRALQILRERAPDIFKQFIYNEVTIGNQKNLPTNFWPMLRDEGLVSEAGDAIGLMLAMRVYVGKNSGTYEQYTKAAD